MPDYLYIRAWGKFLGSTQQHIEHMVTLAIASKAPQEAVYQATDGSWKTMDKLTSLTQNQIRKHLEPTK